MDDFHYDKLNMLNDIYHRALPVQKEVLLHTSITTPLYPHQHTMLQGMIQYREKMTRGFLVENQAINGKMGIIGDGPGTGKTLTALAYLASHPVFPRMTSELTTHSSQYFFSHELHTLSDVSSANLIIVPTTLFDQWKEEIATHTTMKYVAIETKRTLKGTALAASMIQSRVVLTTNRCYRAVQEYAEQNHIQWDNIIMDEASSIYFHSTDPPLRFQFLWLLSHNWIPLLCKHPTINKSALLQLRERVPLHSDLEKWLLENHTLPYEGTLASSSFMKHYLPFFHPRKDYIVLRNSNDHLSSSMNLPPVHETTLACKPSMSLASLTSFYLARNREPSLRASSIPSLFQALRICSRTPQEYVEHAPMDKMELSSRKIAENECVICFESCTYPTIVNCCYQVYCGACLLTNTLLNHKCPTCREVVRIENICCLTLWSPEQTLLSRTKLEVCLDLFAAHPKGIMLLYSPFNNIYYELFEGIDKLGRHAERIENNLFSLRKTMKNIRAGKTSIIFVSDVEILRGFSLLPITHLIFYHELPAFEKKQVLLHSSQRMGRTNPMNVLHLNSEIQV